MKLGIPVLKTFSNAFADMDQVYFYIDIYKRDEELKKALGI